MLIYGNIAHRLCAQTLGLLSLVPGLLFSLAAPGTFETEDDLAGNPSSLSTLFRSKHNQTRLRGGRLPAPTRGPGQANPSVLVVAAARSSDVSPNQIVCGCREQQDLPAAAKRSARRFHRRTKSIFIYLFILEETILYKQTDTGKVEIQDPALEAALQLTPSDKKFISDILDVVQPPTAAPITPEEETRAAFEVTEASQFVGSDGWIRGQFHAYFISMAATGNNAETERFYLFIFCPLQF